MVFSGDDIDVGFNDCECDLFLMMKKVLVMINDLVLMIKNEYFVMIHVLVVMKWS